MTTLAKRLAEERHLAGLSQTALAKKAGCSQATVGKHCGCALVPIAPDAVRCPSCGTTCKANEKYCVSCGHNLH